MKLARIIQIYKSIFPIKNGINSITGSHKFSNTLRHIGGGGLKRILAHLYCIKYNHINICHLGVHKHVPMKNGLNIMYFLYTGSHKSFLIHYG